MDTTRDESGLGDETADMVPAVPPSPEQDPTAYSADLTPVLDPDDFDIDAFLGGMRPFRRAVTLFMRPDLIAELDQLAAAINQGREDLVPTFDSVKAEFYASGKVFVIEGRSAEWVDERRQAMVKDYGLSIKKDGSVSDGPRREEALQGMTHRLLLEQMVIPASNVTEDKLAKIAAALPGEYRKLLAAQGFVNSSLAETSQVLTVDFSRGHSDGTKS